MTLLFLFSISCSVQYNLTAPFGASQDSDSTVIGSWSLRRSIINMKNYFQLTLHHPFTSGGLCQLAPTYFKDWELQAEIRTRNVTGGNGFLLFHSKELCNDDLLSFHGLGVWILPSLEGENVYFINGTGKSVKIKDLVPKCGINFSNKSRIIKLRKESNKIVLESKEKNAKEFVKCFAEEINNMVDEGYFSIFASNSEEYDDNYLYGIDIKKLSSEEEPKDIVKIIEKNLKYSENTYSVRKERKMFRRSLMPYSQKFINQSNELNRTLENNPKVDFSLSYAIINEIIKRAETSVTSENIQSLIAPELRMQLESALEIDNIIMDKLPKLKRSLIAISKYTALSLEEIAKDLSDRMNYVSEEVTEYARMVLETDENSDLVSNMLEVSSSDVKDSNLNLLLEIICLFEFIGYIIFFFYRKNKTNSFKKHN